MTAAIIFLALVVGFHACHIHPIHYYKLHRYAGQYLYLKSAELGARCFLIASFIMFIGYHYGPTTIPFLEARINIPVEISHHLVEIGISEKQAKTQGWAVTLGLTMFLSAYLLKICSQMFLSLRFWTRGTKLHVIGEILRDSPLDSLLFTLSLSKGKYVMLSMSDRKVYVGTVVSMGEPTETSGMDQDILIIPVLSGWRDKDTLKVCFSTFYADANKDLILTLRQEEIVSATEFDFDSYHMWNPPTKSEVIIGV